jgi:glucose uptake protein
MLIPTTAAGMLAALAIAGFLLGTWPIAYKSAGKWRFELFAFDLAIGLVLTSVLVAFTVGNISSPGSFTVDENLIMPATRARGVSAAAGALLSLGTMLLLAGIAVSGMAAAFVSACSTALAVFITIGLMQKSGNVAMLIPALILSILTVVLAGSSQVTHAAATPKKKGMHPAIKGFILSCIGGALLPIHQPALASSMPVEILWSPYSSLLFAAPGFLAGLVLCNLYFLNLPVQGGAVPILDYFKGSWRQHLLGLMAGALFSCGLAGLAILCKAGGNTSTPAVVQALVWPAAALTAVLWGVLFREVGAWENRARMRFIGAVLLMVAASVLVRVAVA